MNETVAREQREDCFTIENAKDIVSSQGMEREAASSRQEDVIAGSDHESGDVASCRQKAAL